MFKTTTIQVGSYGVNCSILTRGETTYIVDPGSEAEVICAFLAENKLIPSGILLTHAHFDHIGGIAGLQRVYPSLKVYVHPNDQVMFGHPLNEQPPDYPLAPRPAHVTDVNQLADPEIEVIEAPGHTPGGVCYYLKEDALLLSGDTLFAGSVGRTDFPGGDMAALMGSLRKLTKLPEVTRVVPGHGPETTIAAELRGNPYLQ